jgi:hypothetical protein
MAARTTCPDCGEVVTAPTVDELLDEFRDHRCPPTREVPQ